MRVGMHTEHLIRRIQRREDELACWSVRARINVLGWRNGDGQIIDASNALPNDGSFAELNHDCIILPPEWDIDSCHLELAPEAMGWIRLSDNSNNVVLRQVSTQHRSFQVPARRFSARFHLCALSSDGMLIPDQPWRATLTWREPAVSIILGLLRSIRESAEHTTDQTLAARLLRLGYAAATSIDLPTDTASYLGRVGGIEKLAGLIGTAELLPGTQEPLQPCHQEALWKIADRLIEELRLLADEYPPQGKLWLVGYSHIDPAWLWSEHVTRELAPAGFATALGQLANQQKIHFVQSSALLYQMLQERDPALFAELQSAVQAGKWEPVGGMWVEPDGNLLSGESWCRQLLWGQRFFQHQLGTRSRVAWLPDSFGFSPVLPQLLASAGLNYFFCTKLRYADTNRFPYDLFRWRGLDGTEILTHVNQGPNGYLGTPDAATIWRTWRSYQGKQINSAMLHPLGYSGGGGPTDHDVTIQELTSIIPGVDQRFGRVDDFFDQAAVSGESSQLPTWSGELYLEAHRGALTSQGRTKYLHRRAEHRLVAAETMLAMRLMAIGTEPESLKEWWENLLRHQSHDIVAGTAIHRVHRHSEEALRSIIGNTTRIVDLAAANLTSFLIEPGDMPGLAVWNPTLYSRPVRAILGSALPGAQATGNVFVVTSSKTVPGFGGCVVTNFTNGSARVDDKTLENDYVKVRISDSGNVDSIVDKRLGREILHGEHQLIAYRDLPEFWDAWELDKSYRDGGFPIDQCIDLSIVERGPHRASIRITRQFRTSTITQEVRLWSNSARVDFVTRLDWHDRRWLVRAEFPLTVHPTDLWAECAFGVIRRSLDNNTSWDLAKFEAVGHRFVDVANASWGVALLNDSRYGHSWHDGTLGLSLLRSPVFPDPLCDEGEQEVTYALLPHPGDWLTGGVLAEAHDLNDPLTIQQVAAGREVSWRPLALRGIDLGFGAFKPAEDGSGIILRTYEPRGGSGLATLKLPQGWEIAAETNVLEERCGPADLRFSPFQVHSWLLTQCQLG